MMELRTLDPWLWDAACAIRGPVDTPKFKDYILPLVFLKRLSEVFNDGVESLMQTFGKQALDLAEQNRKLVRFFISPRTRWEAIRTRSQASLGQYLTDAVMPGLIQTGGET